MKTIVGVPEFLTRAQYLALFEAVGLEPKRLRSLRMATDGVYAEVFEPPEGGIGHTRIETSAPDKLCEHCGHQESDVALHRIYIPVRDPDPEPT